MRSTRREILAGMGGTALIAHAPRAAAKPPPPCPLATPLDAIARQILAQSPETATAAGLEEALDGGPFARRMDDYSPAGEAAWRRALADAGEALAAINCGADAIATLRLDTARALIANALRSAAIPYGHVDALGFAGHVPYAVTPVGGPPIDTVATMADQQSLASPAAAEAWIAKLDDFGRGFAGVAEKIRADEALGCVPPRVLLEKSLGPIRAFLDGPAESHPLILAFRRRMEAAALDAGFRASAEARAATVLDKRARPALAALGEQIAAMTPRGREEPGVWAQPEGEALYAANVRALGDTALAPAAVHALGQEEVRRITAAMHQRLFARGLKDGSVGARMAALAANPANLFADSEAGRAEAIATATRLIRAMEARYGEILPAALIPREPLEVRRLPQAIEAGAPGGFYDGPSLDGARRGIFWINLRDMAALPRFRLPTLSYHEGVPGHHLQNAIALTQTDLPILLRIARFNAYQEGWALYAERLAAEMGAYAHDPLGDLGRLQDELFRAARLVVDTGLHHKRWGRAQAVGWLHQTTGVPESRAAAEVERYMAWPGQALGYALGQNRLLSLRAAMHRRGRYSRKLFHARVLGYGPMPFDLVERMVRRA